MAKLGDGDSGRSRWISVIFEASLIHLRETRLARLLGETLFHKTNKTAAITKAK